MERKGRERRGGKDRGAEGRRGEGKEGHRKVPVMLITHKELPSKIHKELQINKKRGKEMKMEIHRRGN